MRLTPEQTAMVEKHHNLIYWYINKNHLEESEWYDFLAIELCKTVQHYNPERGEFSTYFKLRADSRLRTELKKAKAKKREHEKVSFITGLHDGVDCDCLEVLQYKDWIDGDEDGILQLKFYEGLNQSEIADRLGISQTTVSQKLKEKRKEFDKLVDR